MKRRGVMVCAEYPDIRAGRITSALRNHGWEHDVVCRAFPPQMRSSYRDVDHMPYRGAEGLRRAITRHEGEVIHVHGELDAFWPALVGDGRPLILNVHDLKCARPNAPLDPAEAEALEAADAHVWVSEEQRTFAGEMGLCIDKPYAVVPNYCSSAFFIDKTPLPHIGGVVYEGSIHKRGNSAGDRDFSPIADVIDLHIYPGGEPPDYGIPRDPELCYPLLIHKLAQHDWGLAGYPHPSPSWEHSFPTKASEYWAAGIPVIAMNTPLLRPFCEMGMGIYVTDIRELKKLPDPKPYRKAVMANRQRFTTENHIDGLVALYDEVTR